MSYELTKTDSPFSRRYNCPNNNSVYTKNYSYNYAQGFVDLDRAYSNAKEFDPSTPSFYRHNTIIMAAKKLMAA